MSAAAVRCWGVIPAAGIGSRLGGDLPKQYRQIAGATVLEHSLAALLECTEIEAVAVALHPEDQRPAHMASGGISRAGAARARVPPHLGHERIGP